MWFIYTKKCFIFIYLILFYLHDDKKKEIAFDG